ncbi:hypothetical protein ACVIGB_000948 [Bradyrhizobium sp. USDA 4341]
MMTTSAIRPELPSLVNSAEMLLIQGFPVAVLVGTVGLWSWSAIHFALQRKRRKAALGAKPPSTFMCPHELEFARLLETALPGYHIQAKVALSVLLDDFTALRHHLSRNFVDFLVQDDQTGQVIALVELDDRGVAIARDRERDLSLLQAGYRLVRFDLFSWPSRETVEFEVLGYQALVKPHSQPAGGCQVIPFPRRIAQRLRLNDNQSVS